MASSTPSAPITSSRGAANTTAGRIYFSTPSAHVRVPVRDLVFPPPPPPPTCAHTILLRGKLSRGGKIIPRRRKNCPAVEYLSRAGAGTQKFEKKSENCRTVPKVPYSICLYIEPNYTVSLYIEPNYTLSLYIERTIPYPNILSQIILYVNTLSRTIPYLNTLSRTIPYLNTLSRTHPILLH